MFPEQDLAHGLFVNGCAVSSVRPDPAVTELGARTEISAIESEDFGGLIEIKLKLIANCQHQNQTRLFTSLPKWWTIIFNEITSNLIKKI